MSEPANDEEEPYGLSEEQALRIHHAFINRWCELLVDDAAKDHQRVDSLDDPIERLFLRAKWSKRIDMELAVERAMEKYETPRGKLELIAQAFGDQIGIPGHKIPVDITARLDWYKKRLAAEYEKRVRSDMTWNKVTSPIEQIFLMEWHFLRVDDRHRVTIKPQRKLELDNQTYKIDFMVESTDGKTKIAIEIDGHEFHEKTPQQAQRDRERERSIVRHGYTIFRFTGSEVFRNARKCAEEVIALIDGPQRAK